MATNTKKVKEESIDIKIITGPRLTREDRAYIEEFGNIPDNQMDRIQFILGDKFTNEKYNIKITESAKKIKSVRWRKCTFTLWKIVRPSARPRVSTNTGYLHMYVPRAKQDGDWFEQYAKAYNLPKVETPCILNMEIYEKTPTSWSIKNKVLAELGLIRPWKRTGDFDNYAKGIGDSIQHGMLKDDCLVIESTQKLYYSIKPHAKIEVIYMTKFPEY